MKETRLFHIGAHNLGGEFRQRFYVDGFKTKDDYKFLNIDEAYEALAPFIGKRYECTYCNFYGAEYAVWFAIYSIEISTDLKVMFIEVEQGGQCRVPHHYWPSIFTITGRQVGPEHYDETTRQDYIDAYNHHISEESLAKYEAGEDIWIPDAPTEIRVIRSYNCCEKWSWPRYKGKNLAALEVFKSIPMHRRNYELYYAGKFVGKAIHYRALCDMILGLKYEVRNNIVIKLGSQTWKFARFTH